MGTFAKVKRIELAACIVFGFGVWAIPGSAKAGPLVIDRETGQYKDLAYKALSDEGLSWEERTRL
ncbi:MAG: hypothetical protein ACYS1C_10700, partial [Planctomycetota bacterium]